MALNEPSRLKPLPTYDPRRTRPDPDLHQVFSMPSDASVGELDVVEAACRHCGMSYELFPLDGKLTKGQLLSLLSHARSHLRHYGVPGSIRRKR